MAGGFFIGLGTILKLYPAIFLLFFLIKRQFRAVVSAIAAVLVISLLSLPVVGAHAFEQFWENSLSRQSGLEPFFRNQGLNGALSRLFTENPYVRSLGDHPALVDWAVRALSVGVLLTLIVVTWKGSDAPDVASPV